MSVVLWVEDSCIHLIDEKIQFKYASSKLNLENNLQPFSLKSLKIMIAMESLGYIKKLITVNTFLILLNINALYYSQLSLFTFLDKHLFGLVSSVTFDV